MRILATVHSGLAAARAALREATDQWRRERERIANEQTKWRRLLLGGGFVIGLVVAVLAVLV